MRRVVKKIALSSTLIIGLVGCESGDNLKEITNNIDSINKNIQEINQKTEVKKIVNSSIDKKQINNVEQTICFSKAKDTISLDVYSKRNPTLKTMSICELPSGMTQGSVGDNSIMCGGKCNGRTLLEMNSDGWKIIQVIESLKGAFGMVLEKNN